MSGANETERSALIKKTRKPYHFSRTSYTSAVPISVRTHNGSAIIEILDGDDSASETMSTRSVTSSNKLHQLQRESMAPLCLSSADYETQAQYQRYQYYSRLDPQCDSKLRMPDHLVPEAFCFLPFQLKKGHQSSIVTIFTLWNTMLGTSLLSIPWGIQEAGFLFGFVLIPIGAVLALYGALRIIQLSRDLPSYEGQSIEFSDVCRFHLGRWGELTALIASLASLIGGLIVYYILLCNFAYNSGDYIFYKIVDTNSFTPVLPARNHNVLCYPTKRIDWDNTVFNTVWSQYRTVPFFLLLIVFPIVSVRSPAVFLKLNALGTISVMYLIAFVFVKACVWGIHYDVSPSQPNFFVKEFKPTSFSLTGMLALGFYVHNVVTTITRSQKHQKHVNRDVSIAYLLVALTYIFIGTVFFISFPLDKACIQQNFFDNIVSSDIMVLIGRVFLFVQIISVTPLLLYVLRSQVFFALYGSICPNLLMSASFNLAVLLLCIVFAMFLPHIGLVISFVGAFSGFFYIFALPSIIYLKVKKQENKITWYSAVFHVTIIALAFMNFVGQFMLPLRHRQ